MYYLPNKVIYLDIFTIFLAFFLYLEIFHWNSISLEIINEIAIWLIGWTLIGVRDFVCDRVRKCVEQFHTFELTCEMCVRSKILENFLVWLILMKNIIILNFFSYIFCNMVKHFKQKNFLLVNSFEMEYSGASSFARKT